MLYVRSANAGVVCLCEHAVERVAELVEQCACLVDVEQCRGIALWSCEVAYVDNHRTYILAADVALVHEVCHPCSLTLCGTWEEVGVEHAQVVALAVKNLVGAYLGVIYRDVVTLIIAQKTDGARSQFDENDFAVGNVDNADNADKKGRVQFC